MGSPDRLAKLKEASYRAHGITKVPPGEAITESATFGRGSSVARHRAQARVSAALRQDSHEKDEESGQAVPDRAFNYARRY